MGEIPVRRPRLRLLQLDGHFADWIGRDMPEPPADARRGGVAGAVIRSQPIARHLPTLKLENGLIRYRTSIAPRHWIAIEGSFTDYLAKFSPKTRQTLGRKARKALGPPLEATFHAYRTPDEMRTFIREARALSARTYQERLDTIDNLRTTSITVCCGGIIGMGESVADRISFLHRLATLDPHPESVPINVLSRVPGTPLENAADVEIHETVRMIAAARVLMPSSVVRIAAGRHLMSFSDQSLCFLAGANSFFSSERNMMLTATTPCADHASDRAMLATMGLRPRVLEPSDR